MDRVFWITHKGSKILFTDYTNMSGEELVQAVAFVDTKVYSQYRNLRPGTVLAMADVSGSVASKKAISALKQSVRMWTPLYKRQAVYGLQPLHYIFLQAINKFARGSVTPFNNREEALEWLVED